MSRQVKKYLFLSIQFILYGTYLTLDLLEYKIDLSSYVKFALVLMCFLYVLIFTKKDSGKQQRLLFYGMTFTVVSDIFLLFSDNYFYGVLTFIAVQQLYGIRITELSNRESCDRTILFSESSKGKKKRLKELIYRFVTQILISVILCILLWRMGVLVNVLLIASVFYFISLVTNLGRSVKLWIAFPNIKDIKYFAIGIILFFLCDINVGLFNLSSFINIGSIYGSIYNISSILMWTYYGPSQVMIALSNEI